MSDITVIAKKSYEISIDEKTATALTTLLGSQSWDSYKEKGIDRRDANRLSALYEQLNPVV